MAAVIARPLARIVVSWAIVLYAATIPTNSVIRSSPEPSVQEQVYTLGVWKVKAGQEAEFVAAWKELGKFFR